MSAGQLNVQLVSDSWGTGNEAAAVVEVASAPGGSTKGVRVTKPLSVGGSGQQIPLEAGDYLVRLYLPSGDVDTDYVRVESGKTNDVTFRLRRSPHEWLASAANLGVVQTLPHRKDIESLAAGLGATALSAKASLVRASNDLLRVTEKDRSAQAEGWHWLHRTDRARPLQQTAKMSTLDLARWWVGEPVSQPAPLAIAVRDSHNVVFVHSGSTAPMAGVERAFTAIRDPMGGSFYAVYPQGWATAGGSEARASVLLTVVIDSAMGALEDGAAPVRWRCSPQVDDVEGMSLLGFLYAGRPRAGRALLKQALDRLYQKVANPVGAAMGGYVLLAFMDEAAEHFDPAWRSWIHNLYNNFKAVPDGAIAMAQMALLHGEDASNAEPDAERIRGYALEAVRRGLPYYSYGIRVLTEVLVALEGDDQAHGRKGDAVDQTRLALHLVRRLGRIAQPGEFFTVLKLDEELR